MTSKESKTMEANILRFKGYLERAYVGKFTSNKELCGFKLIAPINQRKYTLILFQNTIVGQVETGKFTINRYERHIYGKHKMKYDILCEIKEGIVGVEEAPVIPVKKKSVTKKKKK